MADKAKKLEDSPDRMPRFPDGVPDQKWIGLLFRSMNNRVFYVPASKFGAYEVQPNDLGMHDIKALHAQLDRWPARMVGIKNALLLDSRISGPASGRIVEICTAMNEAAEAIAGDFTDNLPDP